MMDIRIQTVEHQDQRYDTVGDWQVGGADLTISVSSMDNWKYEFLVALHELVEMMLCISRDIEMSEVDEFDKQWLREHPDEKVLEPGDDSKAPYKQEHFFATSVERLMAQQLGVNWEEYEQKVQSL